MANSEGKKDGIVAEAKERFKKAHEAYSETRKLAILDTKFALGDSDNKWQWPEEQYRQRQNTNRVCLTVNLTAQHVNQVVNQIRQNRPACRVLPVDDYADKKTAEILSGLIRNIQTSSAADDAHDLAAEHETIAGEGYWRIITEYESEKSFDQVIKIKCCPNPQLVYIDFDCKEMDKSDAEWGFIFEDISKEQFKREYPDIDPSSWDEETDTWIADETYRRAEYFYVEYIDDTALLLADGSTMLQSELPEHVIRTDMTLTNNIGESVEIVKERLTKRKAWKWCKLVGGHDEPVDKKDWPGAFLPIVSIVGKEINVDGEIVRKGLVRDLKDPARMVNFSYSETVQTLALQNKVPYMAAAESIEGHEDIWKSANIENLAYLPFNAYDDSGNALPAPSRQAPAVMPSAQVQLLQLSTEEMRGASGQQSSNFGIKSEASSGIGIQRLKQQGEVATFHFPDNLARGLRYEAKVLIDLIQKIYDTRRVVRVLGLDGKVEKAVLDPDQQNPYQEQSGVGIEDIQKIFNPTLGTYDVVIDTGPSFQTQRQEAFASLTDLAGRSPALMQVAGDIIMRAADFPMAEQLAERLEMALPPNLRPQKGGAEQKFQQAMQQSQQAQQQLQLMQQQMQELQTRLQKAESVQERAQLEAQAKIKLAEMDAIFSAQKQEQEFEFKRELALLEAHIAQTKSVFAASEKLKEVAITEKSKAMEGCRETSEAIAIAEIEAESKEEIAELNAYVELQKIGIENKSLTNEVNADILNKE